MTPTRREFLAGAAGLAGAAALAPLARALPAPAQAAGRIKRVVVARFGGGVRLSETFAHPAPRTVIPNLVELAKQGALYTNMRNLGRLDHLTATAQILTGNTYPSDAPLKAKRLPHPTIFEYYRKKTLAGPESCLLLDPSWHPTHLEASGHADYGKGAVEILVRRNTVWHLQSKVQAGRKETDPLWKEADALKQALLAEDFERTALENRGAGLDESNTKLAGPDESKVEQYRQGLFVRELIPRKIGKTDVSVDPGDAMLLFYLHRALQDSKIAPTLIVCNFHGPDVAHRGSFTDYQAAVTALDAVIGELWNVLTSTDNKLKGSTALIVTPDVGRDASPTGGGFAQHRSGDPGCRRLFAVVAGTQGGLIRPQEVTRVVRQTDLCPTIGAWLGVPTPHVESAAGPLTEVV